LAQGLKRDARPVAIVEAGGDAWLARFKANGIETLREDEIGDRTFFGVVLDDYAFGTADVSRWRARVTGPLVQIEDFGEPLPGIDLAINATPGRSGDRLAGVPALLGPTYAMLADPYAGRSQPVVKAKVERVVVSTGWVDGTGATERILGALGRVVDSSIRVDVMLGSNSPNVSRVKAITEARECWSLHCDIAAPWTLLEGADLSISGGGQGLLERLALGIPTLAIELADNQALAIAGIVAAGAAIDLGRLSQASEASIAEACAALFADPTRRATLSIGGQRLVDGQGAKRVVRHLAALREINRIGA
jgi:spore coat polysaccharide biosynthesis predicted glycosyltransferase SpsG